MPELEPEDIRHALNTAREQGVRFVRLRSGDTKFSATLSPVVEVEEEFEEEPVAEPAAAIPATVVAKHVGFLRFTPEAPAVGTELKAGAKFGEIVALGIANDVTVPCDGKLEELLCLNGDPVEFGQVIARIEQ